MIEIGKITTMREAILSELGVAGSRPTVRAVGMAVIRNPRMMITVKEEERERYPPSPVGHPRVREIPT